MPPGLGIGRQVGPFAGEAAEGVTVLARRPAGEFVAQVAGAGDASEGLRVAPRQPSELRRVHFWRHGTAGIGEQPVAACADLLGFCLATVIHPAEYVRLAGERRRSFVGEREGGGGIEGEGGDLSGRLRAGRNETGPDRLFDRRPDVVHAIDSMMLRRPQQGELPCSGGEETAGEVEQPGASRKGADVHGEQELRGGRHGTFSSGMPRIARAQSSSVTRRLT